MDMDHHYAIVVFVMILEIEENLKTWSADFYQNPDVVFLPRAR